jgi:predicted transcriptional regulator
MSVNDSPNHFMVLDAISRGMKTFGKIVSNTKLDKAIVDAVINDLAAQRLITIVEKKGFLGAKKEEFEITETGLRMLTAKKQELEKKFQQFQQWYSNGQMQQLQESMKADRIWLPFMLFSGIMNAMFFMSMMSLMGAAMTPAESAFAGDGMAGGMDDGGGLGDFGGDFGF